MQRSRKPDKGLTYTGHMHLRARAAYEARCSRHKHRQELSSNCQISWHLAARERTSHLFQPGIINVEPGELPRHFPEEVLIFSDHNTQIDCTATAHECPREGPDSLHRPNSLRYGSISKPNACSGVGKEHITKEPSNA